MNIWRISCGYEGQNFYEQIKERKVIAQGWPDGGDLTWLFYSEREPELLRKNDIPVNGQSLSEWISLLIDEDPKAHQAFKRILREIQAGDIVIGFVGNNPVGICEIPDEFVYYYEDRDQYKDVEYVNSLFPVNWVDSCEDLPLTDWLSAAQGIRGIEKAYQFHGITDKEIIRLWNEYKNKNSIHVFPIEDDVKSKYNELLDNKIDLIKKSYENLNLKKKRLL